MPCARCCRVARVKPLGADDPRMLEIALAPSPVASREIDQRGRALFVGAAEVGQHVNSKARAPHQRRLDEIVAEDVAAERRLARQVRQSAMVGERARADDRVVAPVVAVPPHPRAQARAEHRAGHPGGELLQPREHGVAVDDERLALDDPGVGIRLHRRRQSDDRLAGHQTVGVEDDHMRIVAAPVNDEIGDVARFAGQSSCAAAGNRNGRAAVVRERRRKRAPRRSRHWRRWCRTAGRSRTRAPGPCVRRPRRSPAWRRTRAKAPRCRSASRPPSVRASTAAARVGPDEREARQSRRWPR